MDNRKFVEPKQVIVIRKDLNMSAGKLAAQVSHASLGALFSLRTADKEILNIPLKKDSAVELWLNKRFTKIIVYVKSEKKLLDIYEKAKLVSLPVALIKDAGFTEFDNPTFTCVGIGPAFPENFSGITDKLRLFDGEIISS